MASTYRFYVAKTIGDGKTPQTAFRAAVDQYIPAGEGQYWSWANDTHGSMFTMAMCTSDVHSKIAADPNIVALSPELADANAVQAYLDSEMGSGHPETAVLEANGIPCDWILPATTHREFWRFIAARHSITQRLFGQRHPDLEQLKKPLDEVVYQGKSHREHLKTLVAAGGHADLHFGPVEF